MRSYLSLFSLLALVVVVPVAAISAQATATAEANTAFLAPTAEDTSLLWRISADGDLAPSYLFGTIHIIPEADYFLDGSVVRSMNDVEAVLFEIDPSEMQNPAVLLGLMDKLTMRNDTTLEDLLTPSRYDSVANYFNQSGLPFFMFKNMKPMFLSAMVGQDLTGGNPFGGGTGEGGMKNYETELAKVARAGDKAVGGLESLEFQLSLFDSIPYQVQADMLYQSIAADMDEGLAEGGGQLQQMVAMYKARAVAEMSQLITSESQGYGNFEELLVIRRNQTWVPEIIERLATAPTMYAVGAGHLGGEHGVIALLRAQGISVEPVYE
ncbi:TraB/GumN family protein [Neolewinella litorea]|uniref:TraB/GumN family protein n=1 Tax=Neolewinella litorea TaxID=2562452 RepID=A0A4S4N757_9BACT|nr:TraB/GumN family protein [Neolewinella litorea]THH34982.1 TraB/GumN family protein [Neolewinella litorea]